MGEYTNAQMDSVFVAMGDATRRAILQRLSKADARVTDVASEFTISLNSTSKHIKMLERAGLVRRTVIGREHRLSLNAQPMSMASDWIEYYRGFWDDRLEALEKFVTADKPAPRRRKKP